MAPDRYSCPGSALDLPTSHLLPQSHLSSSGPGGELVVVESCTTTWAFDTGRSRFARLPRGLALSNSSAEWRPYHSMRVDREAASVEVALDAAGTQLLRSDIHTDERCPECGFDPAGDPAGS